MKRTFCLTLLYTGCRISEALNLSWDRVDLGEQALVFRTLKQRNSQTYRSVPIPERLLNELGVLWYPGAFDGLVWPWSRAKGYRLIKEVMDRAELTGIKASPKGLRHSFAVACISRGIPITTVKKWMGHARLETTAIYLDFIGEEEREQARLLWKTD
jgi:integrase/recombinase XerD